MSDTGRVTRCIVWLTAALGSDVVLGGIAHADSGIDDSGSSGSSGTGAAWSERP